MRKMDFDKGKRGSNSAERSVKTEAVLLTDLVRRDPFRSLFPMRPEDLQRVRDDIKANGFDESRVVHVWRRPAPDGSQENILVDGFTRVQACEDLGKLSILSYIRTFQNEPAAVDFAIRQQVNRRNLSDAELLRIVEHVDQRKAAGRKSARVLAETGTATGRSSDQTAKATGISRSKVEQVRRLRAHPDLRAEVLDGRLPLRKAAKAAAQRQKPATAPAGATKVNLLLSRRQADYVLSAVRKMKPSNDKAAVIKQFEHVLQRG